MGAKQRIAILTMILLVVFLLFSCVGRGIPKIVLPDLENPEVLDALVQILTGDEDTAASDLIDETTAFDLEGEDAFSFSIQPQEGIEITVIFREQVQPFALVDGVLVYEIDVSTTESGVYEIIIRATIIPPNQNNPRNTNNTQEVRLWIHVVNHPPLTPFNPVPADKAENQPIEGIVLGWDSSDLEGDPITYMVYLGTTEEDLEWIATTTLKNHPLDELAYSTQYFWRVDADDGRTCEPRELTTGDVWSFTTETQMFTLTLDRNNDAWGTVTGGGNYTAGQVINIQATPNAGYRFVHWTRNGTVVSTQANHAYPMPAENVTLVANFEAIPAYTVSLIANPDIGGVLGGAGTYQSGTQVQVTADANEGFVFINWTLGSPEGGEVSGQPNFSYPMPAHNTTLVANYAELIYVEGGTFQMGDAGLACEDYPAAPAHTVNLTYDYWIGKFPVTYTQYDAFCDATGRAKPPNQVWGREDRPVVNISWWDAIAYCNWLSRKEGLPVAYIEREESGEGSLLDADGTITEDITQVEGYRLLTEAEWEYAASGGHEALPIPPRFLYAGSNSIDAVAWYTGNCTSLQPVGGKGENELGLHDMSGNAWEWCYGSYYAYPIEPVDNPNSPLEGTTRMIRGGAWNSNADSCQVAFQNAALTTNNYWNTSFRIARTGATYTLTLEADPAAGGTVEGGGTYSEGREAKIKATPNEGYLFLNWTENGAVVSIYGEPTYTMPAENVTLVANFMEEIPGMVLVKRGTFEMGDEHNDLTEIEKPVHQVELTYDFWAGIYPVTFEEYDLFCDATSKDKPDDAGWGRDDRPVINVTWWDAIAYCNWMSEQHTLAPAYDANGNLLATDGEMTYDITQVMGYRLLTEAEWEYAASGGHQTLPIPPRYLYAGSNNIDAVAWYWGSSNGTDRRTHPVGGKQGNPLGLHDMSGNVCEWCHDRFDWDYYEQGDKTNPIGPSSGSNRVYRGGYYGSGDKSCRVAFRDWDYPHISLNAIGFRLARTHF